jgi:predicted TIM-barrel fold metal-dependent hydrolase
MTDCFVDDEHGVRSLDEIGIDNVMLETDFPHNATEWPHTGELAAKRLAPLTPADRCMVLQGNARRVYNFEPIQQPEPARA